MLARPVDTNHGYRGNPRSMTVMSRWSLHTGGEVEHGPWIDHIASDLACTGLRTWAITEETGKLSDHTWVACIVRLTT